MVDEEVPKFSDLCTSLPDIVGNKYSKHVSVQTCFMAMLFLARDNNLYL